MLALTCSAMLAMAVQRVAVTGAGGQTGQHAFRKMLARPELFDPIGIVRSEASRAALLESGIPEDSVVVADVTDADAIKKAMAGCSALIIGTSAKPVPGAVDEETGRPSFSFPNGSPEVVDWLGQKAQIDAAAACGPDTHVVICSSMGGTVSCFWRSLASPEYLVWLLSRSFSSLRACVCALSSGPEQHAQRARPRRERQGRQHPLVEAQGREVFD